MLSQRCQCAEQGRFGGAERPCMCPCGFLQMNPIRPGGSCHGKDLQRELRVSCCSWPNAVTERFFLTIRKLCKSSPNRQPAHAAWKGSALTSELFPPSGEELLPYFFMPE